MKTNNRKHYPRLRELRAAAGLTQTEIADILEMQQNQYSRYERGIQKMGIDKYIVLAQYYNVSLDYLTGLIDKPRKLRP